MQALHEWETFYVIVGSAAAALTGLQFVVMALGAETHIGSVEQVEAFGTPTVVHFCSVLTIAAIACVPRHSPTSFGFCLATIGAFGVFYGVITAIRARRQSGYAPVLEDWLWHVGFPIGTYGVALITGTLAWRHILGALYWTAALALALLFIGIHNAWDAAVYIATRGKSEKDEKN
ncbi:MAG: hypothetical protein JO197_18415 [Acidobacteria bacterium]|nr:hypothetical protein [Acidobacteriota bacterium]MBV9479078.1 hypothetical protein [Acidobacteriota bacterium]